ncbi:MAG: hypothetical protein AAF664_21495, partial [Planctomycetota bacterium]
MNAVNKAEKNGQALKAFIDRVEAFEIDPGEKSLTFRGRLARENSWTQVFAERVILEYKRFCILAMKAGHPVTPSEQVDQAWHLHLTYTRSYWERFCGETLDAPLHHEPTAGGRQEGNKFQDWYSKTLESYRRLFGVEPPGDIWPSPEDRFRHAGRWEWINTGDHWVVPRRYVATVLAIAIVIVLLLVLPGCQALIGGPFALVGHVPSFHAAVFPFDLSGTDFLYFYAVLCTLAVAVILVVRLALSEKEIDVSLQEVNLRHSDIAVMSGGWRRLAHVSLTRLILNKSIEAEGTGTSKRLTVNELYS